MNRFKLIFLLATFFATSGYTFRCWILCSDQTNIQSEYVEKRDLCREYAQLKLDMVAKHAPGEDDKSHKAQLVTLFAECMNKNGWNVPGAHQDSVVDDEGGRPAPAAASTSPAPNAAHASPNTAAMAADERAALLRSSECNFARYAASTSSIQAARAKACDLECAERLRAAPDAPRPAACPAGSSPTMATGRDTE
jgi:hypothetical protein